MASESEVPDENAAPATPAPPSGTSTRLTQDRWNHLATWPLNAAAILFLIAFSVKVIGNVQGRGELLLLLLMAVAWLAFTVNYVANLVLAGANRKRWFIKNWYQLAITAIPALNPLRLLRLINMTTFFAGRTKGSALRGRVSLYVASTLIVILYVGALMVLDAEQNAPGATIVSMGDAIWWAIVTVTTVGYGDFVPITVRGRLVAGGLMLTGVGVIGTITGTLASYLAERTHANDRQQHSVTARQVADLSAQIASLEKAISERGGS